MKLKLGSFVLASLFALPMTACMVHGSGGAYVTASAPVAVIEVESEPPPPRRVYVAPRAGHIWIEGRWDWRGGQWVWRDGYWERERVGYVYAPGRWERRGRRHVWIEGRWNAGAHGNAHQRVDRHERRDRVRDHRDDRRDRRDNGRGPIIRDHR